jgi:putative FmdB family regulatory protein
MPIYAYRCAACGHAKDVLQKLSDPLLTTCPACGAESFSKQLTAAGFQLKGSGWYATDFKGGSSAPAAKPDGGADKPADKPADKSSGGDSASSPPAASTASTACGGSCACH